VLSGFIIPGLLTRRVDTTVKLWSGQSYLIAGMYFDESINTNDNLYGLNKIPWLGGLFGSNRYEDQRTELLVIVTPYLVQTDEEYQYRCQCRYECPCECSAEGPNVYPFGNCQNGITPPVNGACTTEKEVTFDARPPEFNETQWCTEGIFDYSQSHCPLN